jgi:hypothetical protein
LRRTYSYEINAEKRIFYFSALFLKIRETERNELEKRREDGRHRERERERELQCEAHELARRELECERLCNAKLQLSANCNSS